MPASTTHTQKKARNFNKLGYAVFTVAGIFFTFLSNSPDQGPMFLMLALVCDPFEAAGKWADRQWWQRGILVMHMALAFFTIYWVFIR